MITNFIDTTTIINATWLNKVDRTISEAIGNGTTNPTTPTEVKQNLGLQNVDNTTDLNKPISTATQTALDNKAGISGTVTKDSLTGSAVLPAGTTAQRTGSPTDGNFRYNSTLQALEAYYNSKWNPLLQFYVNVKEYGATGDGTTDDTTAINTANTAATALGSTLFFPAGTYISSGIPAIAGMNWLGENPITTIIKLKNGTNAGLVTSASNVLDDMVIDSLQFHGNYQNNTSGDTLTLKGARLTMSNVIVSYAAGNGIVTDWDVAEAGRDLSFLSTFDHILVYKAQQTGWVHNGPSDCHFNNIEIIDTSLQTTNTYYGLRLVGSGAWGSGRFTNVHYWNESGTTNVPVAGVSVESGGNNFVNCHFEGSNLPLNITGGGNTFVGCSYYASRGSYLVNIASTAIGTLLTGSMGLTTYGTNHAGIYLAGSTCTIDVTNIGQGCINGLVDFSVSAGKNNVKAVGYQTSGTHMIGTPHATDDVLIQVNGISNAAYKQDAEIPWTVYTPTVTSSGGALGSATGTGRYQKLGKTVHFCATATITTNGTGSGTINITLPFTAVSASYNCVGRENTAGKMLQGTIYGTTSVCTIVNYDNSYPAVSGSVILITGTYEVA